MNVMSPVVAVLFVGVNVIKTFIEAPGTTVPDVGLTTYFVENEEMDEITRFEVPVFATITESIFGVPTLTVPKLMLDGVALNTGVGTGAEVVTKLRIDAR